MSSDPLVFSSMISDVLDPFSPTMSIRVFYNNRITVAGCDLRPSAIVNRPKIEIGGGSLRDFYTLVLVDPDAPSPTDPNLRSTLHWMVTDIPGSSDVSLGYSDSYWYNFVRIFTYKDVVGAGQEVVIYERPQPTAGIHRMVFVLYQQTGRATVFPPDLRHNFNCRSFARQYHLEIMTAVYFNCQRESGSGGRRFRPHN